MSKVIAMTTILLLASFAVSNCNVGCLKCSSSNDCLMCDFKSGYVLSESRCVFSLVANCQSQSISGSCLQCSSGNYLDLTTQKCVGVPTANRINNCQYYSDASSCTQCTQSFYLSNNTCVAVSNVISNCTHALGPSLCQECASGFALSADNTGCVQISNTGSCMLYSTVECSSCKAGFDYNVNSLLYVLRDAANSSSIASNASALAVGSSGTVPVANRCSAVTVSNCTKLTDFETCAECETGFYIGNDGNCVANPSSAIPNCSVYGTINQCKECLQGYYLKSATECGAVTKIDKCSVYDGKASSTKCNVCEPTHYVANNACTLRTKAVDGCTTYTADADNCGSCSDSRVPTSDGLKCLPALTFCASYVQSNVDATALTCARCEDKFYWNGTACDLGSTVNCLSYLAAQNVCQTCEEGYYLTNSNRCSAHNKVLNCEEYDNLVANKCVQCNDRSAKLSKTTACTQVYIEGCDTYASETHCQTCKPGYDLQSSGKCALISTDFNCTKMVLGECVQCNAGYMLDGGVCSLPLSNMTQNCLLTNLTGTISSAQKTCLKCNNGSIFYNYKYHSQCVDAQYVKNTYSATLQTNCLSYRYKDDALICVKCRAGLYLKDGSCESSCGDADTIRAASLEYDQGDRKFSVSSVNNCVAATDSCAVQYPLQQQALPNVPAYGCAKCQANTHAVVDITTDTSIFVKGEHVNATSGAGLFFSVRSATCDSTTLIRHAEVPQCRQYYPLVDGSIGCISCDFGYSGLVNNFTVDNCHKYDIANEKCIACQQGYFLQNEYVCTPVAPISFCELYSTTASSSVCVKCKTSSPIYYLSNNECQLTPAIANCVRYSLSSNTCEVCDDSTVLLSDKSACVLPIDNCSVYRIPTVGVIGVPGIGVIGVPGIGGILGPGVGGVAGPGLIIPIVAAEPVSPAADTESYGSDAITLAEDEPFKPIDNEFEVSLASQDVEDFFPGQESDAVLQNPATTTCQTCKKGYYPNSFGTACIQNIDYPYCNEYDGTTSGKCIRHNLIPMYVNSICSAPVAIPNCTKYSNKTTCAECDASGYYLSNNYCVPFGKYVNASNTFADIAAPNCKRSTSLTGDTCAECLSGFNMLVDTSAGPAVNKCCAFGSFLQAGACTQDVLMQYNTFNCAVYNLASGYCAICKTGFYLGANNCCALGSY